MIKLMSKIQLIGSKALMDEVIKALHELGIVHIESIPRRITLEDTYLKREPVEREKVLLKERLEKILERIKGICMLLPAIEREDILSPILLADINSNAFLHEIDILEKEVRGLQAGRAEFSEEMASIEKYEKILKGIAPLVAKLKGINQFETMGITIDRTKEGVIPLLETEIDRITEGRYQLFIKDIDEDMIGVVITYPKNYDAQVKALISSEAISEIKLPEKYVDMTLFDALKGMVRRREEIPALIDDIDNKLKQLSEKWYKTLEDLMGLLRDTIDELTALAYCAHTRFTFVIVGWIPKDTFNILSSAIVNKFGDRVMVREMEIREDEIDLIPVCIKNPKLLRPFEVFLKVLPPPKYGSVDPTPYLALFFPTFFGLILGDIGYGAILFGLSLYLKERFKANEYIFNLASVFMISSLFAMIFGILFGEFFGGFYFPFGKFFGDDGVGFKQGCSAPRHNALFHGGFGRFHGVFYFHFHVLHFRLGGGADFDNGHSADQFGQSFLQFFFVKIGIAFGNLFSYRRDSGVNILFLAFASDDGRVVFGGDDFSGFAQHIYFRLVQLQTHFFGNDFSAGYNGDILQHLFFPVAVARGFNGQRVECPS